jgi:[CysO sulfur-carrier protein]-S-L-cysteine hydrolase
VPPERGAGWPMPRLVALAEAAPAEEVCGLLVRSPGGEVEAWPIANASGTPATAFELEPGGLLLAMRRLDEAGGQLVAIYHSHLAGGAGLSPRDLDGALADGAPLLGGVAQLVVALEDGQATAIRAHWWSGHAFEPTDMWPGELNPPQG